MAKKDEKDLKEQETAAEEAANNAPENESESALEKLQSDYDALNDCYMRTLAEYDNFRKRSQKDIEARVSYTKTDMLSKILPVIDNFERAAFNADTDFDGYKKGIEMTVSQFMEILKGMGVEAFGEAGEAFDPNFHNGVMHIEDDNLGENVIADVFMKGYKIGDKVIRAATVKVAN